MLGEPPLADFAIDEALYLADRQLADPLVHLRVKQLRTISVAIYAGVNLNVALAEQRQEQKPAARMPKSSSQSAEDSVLSLLVEALLPILESRLSQPARRSSSAVYGVKKPTRTRPDREKSEPKLPLDD